LPAEFDGNDFVRSRPYWNALTGALQAQAIRIFTTPPAAIPRHLTRPEALLGFMAQHFAAFTASKWVISLGR
jgi:hypothetical protein